MFGTVDYLIRLRWNLQSWRHAKGIKLIHKKKGPKSDSLIVFFLSFDLMV